MKLYNHFAAVGFSNTYLLAAEHEGSAILIDPGKIDVPLLQLIENNNYYIKDILITHGHKNHFGGVKTLLKLYDAQIYSAIPDLDGSPSNILKAGIYNLSGLEIEVIPIMGHSYDSLVYRIEDFFFTGDILSAGRTGTTPDNLSSELLYQELEDKLFTRDGHGIILPGHGPPTSIRSEKNLLKKYKEY